jgi:NTP pyrophosphatase (non-canonical NTP hydrolase)
VNLADYFDKSARFCTHYPDSRLDAYAHGLMAEVGEVEEALMRGLRGEDLLLEFGDVAWNIVQAAGMVGLTPNDILKSYQYVRVEMGQTERRFVVACSKVSGLLEKSHRKGRSEDAELHGRLLVAIPAAWQSLNVLASLYGYTMARVMAANIEKLTVRYGKESA